MTDSLAVITYRYRGTERTWTCGADSGKDNATTMRAHVLRWIPGAEFVSVKFQPVPHVDPFAGCPDCKGELPAVATCERCEQTGEYRERTP
jgi:hypothetical protein